MDASSAEGGESVELESRVAAPAENRVPLMSLEDIKKEEERIEKEREELVKDMKELTKDIENVNRWQKSRKYSEHVTMFAAPVVSIIMIVIGSLYLEDCTVQPYIPIYLVVGASFGIFVNVISISWKCFCADSKVCKIIYYSVGGLISIFSIVWLILGCVWVYGVQEVEFEDTFSDIYCHKTLYYFSFWLLNVVFISLGLSIISSLCLCWCLAMLKCLDDD